MNHGQEQMGRSVEILAIILFGVVGLSHILQPKAWAEFFILLRDTREVGAFVDGFLNLPLGGVIVAFHDDSVKSFKELDQKLKPIIKSAVTCPHRVRSG